MCHRWYLRPPFRLDLIGHHHERRRVIRFKILPDFLRQDRWAEGAEWLPIFYAPVKDVFHVTTTRVSENASVAQGARTKFHPPLKPTYNVALANCLCGFLNELVSAHVSVAASR